MLADPPSAAPARTPSRDSEGRRRVALVVDDYITIRKNHKILLEKLGFKVIEAADGGEALRLLQEAGPGAISLMIVDLVMPVMNGAELIELCRQQFGDEAPRLLVCSSVSELPIVKKIVSLGIDGYIVKPVNYGLLVKKINEIFQEDAEKGAP